ncbi:AimR family lysis-lysogeny pheromone receptor [Bacillus altitudinis]|uniref:AimR family lysis-lysogeny pheromone receptor n=1 Tax=Bacillus altitudinis TaxID=293387 RepID=UPI003CFDD53C
MLDDKINIQNYLKESILSKGLTQKKVSLETGISEGQLSKFFSSGHEISFSMVLDLVQLLAPEKEIELMTSYVMNITRKKNQRIALEYAHVKRIHDLSRHLIEKGLIDQNEEVREWSQIYHWQFQAKQTDYNEREFLSELKKFKAHSTEMEALLMILEMYSFFYNKNLEIANYYIEGIKEKISEISDPFIYKAFMVRLDEAVSHIALKFKDNVQLARQASERILVSRMGPTFDSTAYFILGISYMMESYERAYEYLNHCLSINEDIERFNVADNIKENISILQFWWGKEVDYLNPFIKTLIGEAKTQIKFDKEQQAYVLLFEGIKEKNCVKLLLSMHLFLGNNDVFRARLPKIELLKIDSFESSILKEVIG